MGIESSEVKAAAAADLVASVAKSAPEPKPVKVESKPVKPVEDAPEPEAKTAPKAEAKPLKREQAEKVASEVEAALNRNNQTVVQFNVSLVAGDGEENSFKFQVVDRKTGKVIRQFPPEDILNVQERLSADPPKPGVFVDSQA